MAHPKHEEVRQRYQYRCGYYGVSETNCGGELTVDHFRPRSIGDDESDDNLVYACFRCNLHKSDTFPTSVQQAQGIRLLHPLLDDLSVHFRENVFTGELEALTEAGRFHIETIQLNRPALIACRKARNTSRRALLSLEMALQDNARLRESIALRELYQEQKQKSQSRSVEGDEAE